MEYVITTDRPFDEIEAVTIDALQSQGLVVQSTFRLRSAVGTPGGDAGPGYTVMMLYAPGVQRRSLGLLTLYEHGRWIVIKSLLTPAGVEQISSPGTRNAAADADADLVAALILSGLDFCVDSADVDNCIDAGQIADEAAQPADLIQDPVCGKRIGPGQAEAAIEHGGTVYHVCCSLCREAFERHPGRYVRAG
jgi:YHS domain-containing protein